jgi:hypothetical protein
MIDSDYRAHLHRELQRLRAELQADLDCVACLRAIAVKRDEIDRLAADLDHQIERLPRAAVVTLVGATGAGKSALLNALVGEPIAEEGIDRPTTREPVVYAPHEADLTVLLGAVNPEPRVVRYQRSATGPWSAQVLIDAPDLNSVAHEHRITVTQLAERSDVLLVVLHRQSVVEEASVSFVDAFSQRRRFLFVLNRIDELAGESGAALLSQVRALAAERWRAPDAPVVSVSARLAQQQPNAPGWRELCGALSDLVRESAIGGVRRLNALGIAARLEQIFARAGTEVEEDLERLPDEASAGVSAVAQLAADEVAMRLRLRRADVTALLVAETAKRWDGPSGWALRAGGAGTVGLGAGVLLARRHPLLGAGTAAGSLAIEQLRNGFQRERLGDADGLLPAPGEVAQWCGEALGTARLRAARLAGEPEVLGLPVAEELRSEIGAAVAEAWTAFVTRDLPAAAQRSALRFFQLLLDLPVYALAGWVVYRVATGFAGGNYTGVDFLINAFLLLAAYLLATTFLIRRLLGFRARRLLDHITVRGREAVHTRSEAARHAVAEITGRIRDALRRLTTLSATWQERLGNGSDQ